MLETLDVIRRDSWRLGILLGLDSHDTVIVGCHGATKRPTSKVMWLLECEPGEENGLHDSARG